MGVRGAIVPIAYALTLLPVTGGAYAQTPDAWRPPSSESRFDEVNRLEEANVFDKAFPLDEAIWPDGIVQVCWESPSEAVAAERELVRVAIEGTWQEESQLRFVGWGTCIDQNIGVRISVADTRPHVKMLGRFLDAVPSGMVLNFSFKSWNTQCLESEDIRRKCIRYIAIHEFGHAIGFAHEQNRPDTPGACAKRREGSMGSNIDITPWDINSVMNYCNINWINNGKLSEFDISAVRYIYGEPKRSGD